MSEVRVARVNGTYLINPTKDEMEGADLDVMIAGTEKDINMLEGEMQEISEEDLVEVIKIAHEAIKEQCAFQLRLAAEISTSNPKRTYCHEVHNDEVKARVYELGMEKCKDVARMGLANKAKRTELFDEIKSEIKASYSEEELVEIPAFEDSYTTAVPGFQVELAKEHDESFYSEDGRPEGFPLVESAIEQRMGGLTMTTVIVNRSFAVKMIALLVAIFCLIIAFTLCYMTIEIVRRNRPPSMQVLVWAAANALGLISVRSLLPGAPRIGITFDIVVYFPALTATLISTVALFVLWAYREDWQI